ncbi:transposase [Christiangramia fulva]|uniref:Transposase n=1 Tax=Christiangramia fulva TaxID=2126553 RepID=A0A2R3Z3F7_9FLAO|nr:recombinase family protein [Christiangramia fulva]AVR44795.1 transposase [Christiangramia fulva]
MEKVFFYSRISSITQNGSRQMENFKKHSQWNPETFYIDKIQGNVPFLERPEASKLYNRMTSVDPGKAEIKIVVDSIDRLGRNLMGILQTIELFNSQKINLQSLKEGFETRINGKENPVSKIVVSVMASIAEMERNRIKERTREGIQLAKAKGKYRGRKVGSKQTDERLLQRHPVIVEKLKKGLTVRDVAAIANKSTATVVKVRKTLVKREAIF